MEAFEPFAGRLFVPNEVFLPNVESWLSERKRRGREESTGVNLSIKRRGKNLGALTDVVEAFIVIKDRCRTNKGHRTKVGGDGGGDENRSGEKLRFDNFGGRRSKFPQRRGLQSGVEERSE